MLHELWDDPAADGRFTFCLSGPRGDDARAQLSPMARLVWTVDAPSRFEAMTRYYERQGWGTYTTDQEWDHRSYADLGWEFDGRPVRGSDSQAAMLTRRLRSSDEPYFSRIRDLLGEHGIDAKTTVLAQLFPDDVDQEFGVLVAADNTVHTFVMHYGRRGDLKTRLATATIPSLDDISDQWQTSQYVRYVREALTLPEGWDD